MPEHPRLSTFIEAAAASVFSRLRNRAEASGYELAALHLGDTYKDAPEGCRMQDLLSEEIEGLHRYSPVEGQPALLSALAERATLRHGRQTTSGDVLVTAGATGGLGAAFGAIVDPGDEVIVLTPYWPLITGILRGLHARAVLVPLLPASDEGQADAALVSRVEAACTDRTVALYLNTPNNPTGRVLNEGLVLRLTDLARRRGLWVVADECYEDYVYAGQHAPARHFAPERTFSVHSFSKAFGMAGNRCGYVVSPPGLTEHLRKVSLHTFYATPTAAQFAALRALDGPGDAFVAATAPVYAEVGRACARLLGIPPPESGTFLFFELSAHLGQRPLIHLLEHLADHGLLLAPGPSFGPYPSHARLCFTALPPERTLAAVGRLTDLLVGG